MSYKINSADRRPTESVNVSFSYSQTFQGFSDHEHENENLLIVVSQRSFAYHLSLGILSYSMQGHVQYYLCHKFSKKSFFLFNIFPSSLALFKSSNSYKRIIFSKTIFCLWCGQLYMFIIIRLSFLLKNQRLLRTLWQCQKGIACSCKVTIKLCINKVHFTDNPNKEVGMNSEL